MRKLLLTLLTITTAFVIGYTYQDMTKGAAIAKTSKAGPTVRVPNIRPERIEAVKKITVLISNEGFGGIGRGTGVLIDKEHVLTCAHLIESLEDDLWVYLYDGTFVHAKPVHGSARRDLAILKLSKPVRLPFTPVFQDKVLPGEPMAIIGNALGAMKWYVSGGVVSGEFRDWLLTDAFQIGGNSGGPWINAKGEIIALAAWGHSRRDGTRTGVNGGISGKVLRRFVWEYRNPPKTLQEFFKRMMDA